MPRTRDICREKTKPRVSQRFRGRLATLTPVRCCAPLNLKAARCAPTFGSQVEKKMNTTNESATLPRLLTARQVSEATGIPLPRLYELTRTGDLPHTRLGRTVRYAAPALRDWIDGGGTGEWESP